MANFRSMRRRGFRPRFGARFRSFGSRIRTVYVKSRNSRRRRSTSFFKKNKKLVYIGLAAVVAYFFKDKIMNFYHAQIKKH